MTYLLRIFVTFCILLLGYECMVRALDLMNRPSDRAVFEGTVALVLLGLGLPFVLWRYWRRYL